LNIVIVGCGDVGIRCAKILTDAGHRVLGVRRNTAALPQWLVPVEADVLAPESLEFLNPDASNAVNIDVLIYSLAAASFDEQAYREAYVTGLKNTLNALGKRSLKRCFYVSSTGVYHQNESEWVDENSPTIPTRFNGQLVLEGEQLVRARNDGTCVRYSGIYGPGRLRMINRVAAGQATPAKPEVFTNRIHIEDCAGALAHLVMLAETESLEPVYLASDSRPATSADVEACIAETLGLTFDSTEPVPGGKRIAGSKRCSNKRLLDSGYQFKYPDFRAGYRQVIDDMQAGH
jgi:nucleoside-diphosphate-sugar epimerase